MESDLREVVKSHCFTYSEAKEAVDLFMEHGCSYNEAKSVLFVLNYTNPQTVLDILRCGNKNLKSAAQSIVLMKELRILGTILKSETKPVTGAELIEQHTRAFSSIYGKTTKVPIIFSTEEQRIARETFRKELLSGWKNEVQSPPND